jgi:hypothetical protein
MHGLGMLSKVVQAGKTSRAMTLERPLTSVLPNMPGQMFAPREAQVARRKICAEESLSFLLLRRPFVAVTLVVRCLCTLLRIRHFRIV